MKVSENAYEAYMDDSFTIAERFLALEEVLLTMGNFFSNPKVSLKQKNSEFEKLYAKYGIHESRLYKSGDLKDDTKIEDACLRVEKKKFGQIWEQADKVFDHHFRNLPPNPSKAYLQKKWKGFLDRQVGCSQGYLDDWLVIEGRYNDSDYYSTLSSACCCSNNFLENYI